jgi:hypothetical protein
MQTAMSKKICQTVALSEISPGSGNAGRPKKCENFIERANLLVFLGRMLASQKIVQYDARKEMTNLLVEQTPMRWHLYGLMVSGVLLFGHPTTVQAQFFNPGGFESPTFTNGNIGGQQSFIAFGSTTGGVVQNSTVFAGSQAFQISGANLNNSTGSGFAFGNFYYREYTNGAGANQGFAPVAAGTPFVQIRYKANYVGTIATPNDIPLVGPHIEAYTAAGLQQTAYTAQFTSNRELKAFTNTATSSTNVVTTAAGFVPTGWVDMFIEMNFTAQTYQVYMNNSLVSFTGGTPSPITNIPFRNTFGNTVRFAELGMVGFMAVDPNTGQAVSTTGDFFMDDYSMTASVSSMAPVPEPASVLTLLAVAGVAYGRYRRRSAN